MTETMSKREIRLRCMEGLHMHNVFNPKVRDTYFPQGTEGSAALRYAMAWSTDTVDVATQDIQVFKT